MKPILAATLATILAASPLRGADSTNPLAPARFERSAIDAYLSAIVQRDGIVGLSVAVARNGQIEFAKGYGVAALNTQEAVSTNTVFSIGSVTKQFTCACILLLAEEGKLSVRDKVSQYFPTLTRADEITLLDLMNHVSGYPDYYPLDFVDRRLAAPIAADDLIRQYATRALDFEPGGALVLQQHRIYYPRTGGGKSVGRIAAALSPAPHFRPGGHESHVFLDHPDGKGHCARPRVLCLEFPGKRGARIGNVALFRRGNSIHCGRCG